MSSMDECIAAFEESLRLLLLNNFVEAKALLASAITACAPDCDPGIKAVYRLGLASVSLAEALGSGAVDQAVVALPLLEEGEEEAGRSSEFFVHTLIRGGCLLFSSFCLFLQQRWTSGAFTILKAWRIIHANVAVWLAHERKFVRSFAQLLVGAMNLTISVFPSAYVSVAEFAGFDGSRIHAVEYLRNCAAEGGCFGPLAMLVLTGFFAALKPFIFEHMTPHETSEVQKYLVFGQQHFAGSYFFALCACVFHQNCRDAPKAVQSVGDLPQTGPVIPALQMMLLCKKALAFASALDFHNTKQIMKEALLIQLNNNRRTYLPYLAFLYFLASGAAGTDENAGFDALELIDTYREDEEAADVWLPSDKWAFRRSKHFAEKKKKDNRAIYIVELLFGAHIFESLLDKLSGDVLEGPGCLQSLLDLTDCSDVPWDVVCKRNIVLAEVFRSHNRLGEALRLLDEILDSEESAEVGAADAIIPLALILQGIVFVQAGEVDAARESMSDLDTALVASTTNLLAKLSKHTVSSGTEYDTYIFFKRHALEKRIEAGGFESADSSEPE